MMKVYICPKCGWIRTVSRRNEVECFKCGNERMVLAKIPYEKYGKMSEKERKDYSESWLYIHRNSIDRRRTYFFHRKLRKNSVVPDRVGLV